MNVRRWKVLSIASRIERATRPVDPRTRAALDKRWAELPEGARTPAQTLGRHAVGCEGTHGVFPKCNLTCTPCYHSADANKVRIDGEHTVREVESQMAFLESERGPRAHAQLIGGEVSLLAPEDHAAALTVMRNHGREPMSFTHGDFDYDYLRAVAVDSSGRPRFQKISFAAHFDSLMRGRRGIPRPRSESDLSAYRRSFVDMFTRLRSEYGISSYLAHNMTVTPENIEQVAGVVEDMAGVGYSMLSFQPAAFIGDSRRWRGQYQNVDIEAVWQQIERGLGQPIPHDAVQFGDTRCNRTALGFMLGGRWHAFADMSIAVEERARDEFYVHLGGMNFGGTRPVLLAAKLIRSMAAHPSGLLVAARWARSLIRRCGGFRVFGSALVHRRMTPMTFEVHQFMDAADVAPAWALMQEGTVAEDPAVRATQERLAACTYSMAHPETGQLVPACAQHSVLDPGENNSLRTLLPLTVKTQAPSHPAKSAVHDSSSSERNVEPHRRSFGEIKSWR